jgi:type IV pilus assembly protein PilB
MATEEYTWRLGEILVQNQWVTWENLEKALQIQASMRKKSESALGTQAPSEGDRRQTRVFHLGEILVQHNWVNWTQLFEALKIQKMTGRILGEILMEKGFVSSKNLFRGLAIQFNMPFVDFDKISVQPETLEFVPKRIAYDNRVMPVIMKNTLLVLAIDDPMNNKADTEIHQLRPDIQIQLALTSVADLTRELRKHYGPEEAA